MRYAIDTANVSHERLHDEVIIINLKTGAYYSGSGPAADLWDLLCQGAIISQLASVLASEYSCDEALVLQDINGCLDFLVECAIIQVDGEIGASASELVLPKIQRAGWIPPKFEEYTDMWDLIQLDPIHDVGEAGWPFAAPPSRR